MPASACRAPERASARRASSSDSILARSSAGRGRGEERIVAAAADLERETGARVQGFACDVTDAARVRELEPDGLFLSNGPGDPAAVTYVLPEIRSLAESGLPTFGICLGHQLLALSLGGETAKLPYGHRGGNHPVRDLDSGRVLITSQNHGFAVRGTSKAVSGANALEVTHRNLNDDTVEGLRHRELPLFAVQYHPEASPGPHDARGHFTQFVQALDSQQVSPYL